MAIDWDKIKEDAGTLWDKTLPGAIGKGIGNIAGKFRDSDLSIMDLDPNPVSRTFRKLVKMLMERYNIPQTQAEAIARNQMADANVLPEGPGTADEGFPERGIDAGAEDPWDIPEQETSKITREDIRKWREEGRPEWMPREIPPRYPQWPPREIWPSPDNDREIWPKIPDRKWPPRRPPREIWPETPDKEYPVEFLNKGGRVGYQTGGITESRVLPPEYIEALGKTYAADLTRQAGIPSITTATAQQPGETAQQWQQRQAQAQQYGITKAGMAELAPQVAAQDPYQAAAYAQAVDPTTGLGAYQPYLTKAGTAATAATDLTGPMTGAQLATIDPTTGQTITPTLAPGSYMSPYQQQVIDATMADYDAQAAKSRLALGAPSVAGVFGGGRHGIAEAEFDALSNRGRASQLANLRAAGFQQAQQARQQDLQNQMGLSNLQQGLGGTQQDFARAQIAGLGTLGATQQAQNQAVLDAQRQFATMAVQEPVNRMNLLGTGVMGLMGGMSPYSTRIGEAPETPQSSPLATALGVGLTGADIYSRLYRPKGS